MALNFEWLKVQCNVVGNDDDQLLTRQLSAAQRHVERILGFAFDDETELPDGVPEDLEQAVLMLAAHWYENREQTITGTIIAEVPFGVMQILGEHRRYTFG